MSPLAARQNALLAALFAGPGDAALAAQADLARYAHLGTSCGQGHRGLQVYQANGHGLAQRALNAVYPVLAQLIGGDSFAALARALWHTHPPERGDLAQWGGHLAAFIQRAEQLADEPYLPDVARLEWALHQCASAADAKAEPSSWVLLTAQDPAELTLTLAPGCTVLASAWPVTSIWQAHVQMDGSGAPKATGFGTRLEAAGQKLRAQVAETAVVWREQLQARVREAMPGEAAFLRALAGPAAAGEAPNPASICDLSSALNQAPLLDFNAWLPMAVQSGLLLGVTKRR